MADHLREQIMSALVTDLTGLTTTGSNIARGRVYSLDDSQLPYLSIYQMEDVVVTPDGADEATNIYMWNALSFVVKISVDASTGILDTQINQICKEVVIALMSDVTLGGICSNIIEISTGPVEFSSNREKRTAIVDMNFNVLYRRLRTDPSQ